MSSLKFERLTSDLQANPGLRAEFRQIREAPDSAVSLAAAKGYHLTRQEAEDLLRRLDGLSDAELDQAAGGAWNYPPPTGTSGTD